MLYQDRVDYIIYRPDVVQVMHRYLYVDDVERLLPTIARYPDAFVPVYETSAEPMLRICRVVKVDLGGE
jgi:hypothetical protein